MINAATVTFHIITVHRRFSSQVITQNALLDVGNEATVTGIVQCLQKDPDTPTPTKRQDDIREFSHTNISVRVNDTSHQKGAVFNIYYHSIIERISLL